MFRPAFALVLPMLNHALRVCRSVLPVLAVSLAITSPAAAQSKHDGDVILSIARRTLAAEKAAEALAQDPIALAISHNDAQSIINAFRTGKDRTARERAVGAIIQIGGNAPGRLMQVLQTELTAKMRNYKSVLQDEVVATLRRKRGEGSVAEVTKLQQQIADLQSDPGLTKDMIVKTGDPAIKRLEDLLTIDRRTVLAGSKPLAAAKQELADVMVFASRLSQHVTKEDRRLLEKFPSVSAIEADLNTAEEMAAVVALPIREEWQEVLMQNIALSREIDSEEAKGIEMLNLMRLRAGMQPLLIDLKLNEASRGHSKDMRTLGFFAHESPVSGKRSPWDRAKLAGTSASGENIFMGSANHDAAIMAWWHSPGHFKNMMNPGFRRIGLGRLDVHWTQMFGS